MLQNDVTNAKYYEDGVEITKEEYDILWKEWHNNLPPPPPPDPDPEIDDSEFIEMLLGVIT